MQLRADKKTIVRLSCDSDYTLFINGEFVASNQYGDYEHYKIYDELDVSDFVKDGENTFAVLVWYWGENTQRYLIGVPGFIYEIVQNEKICAASDTDTLCRKSLAYKSGYDKQVTKPSRSKDIRRMRKYLAALYDGALRGLPVARTVLVRIRFA